MIPRLRDPGPTPDYGRHAGTRIANLRNRGLLQESDIVWGMDLVSYVPTNNPRHARAA